MRRSVFLAVWLSLVLSLLKETAATSSESTTVPTVAILAETAATSSASTTVPMVAKLAETAATSSASTTVPTVAILAEPNDATSANTTASTMTKPPVDFCREYPCGRNLATCISLQSSYTCECQYGFYYSNENCYRGKIYPATIGVGASYSASLHTVNSTEYEKVFNNITEFFRMAFHDLTDYAQTVIVKIQPAKESENSGPLNVTVSNLFTWNSAVNETSINSTVQLAIINGGGNQSYVYSYEETKYCAIYQCDTQTTECQEDMFPECKCKPDFEKTDWDDRSCSGKNLAAFSIPERLTCFFPSTRKGCMCFQSNKIIFYLQFTHVFLPENTACSNCSEEEHKHCVKEKTGPTCKCMTNFKKEDVNCVACRVGYSGEECRDNSGFILIIVGAVSGAIILSLMIAVCIISVRAKGKRTPEKRTLIQPEYSNTNRSDNRPGMFPRVQTTSGHANPGYQSNNPYEMHSTNRGHFPERDYDDLYEISREPRSFRMQSRY
ncbi:mucin-13 [Cyanocitta cristata]